MKTDSYNCYVIHDHMCFVKTAIVAVLTCGYSFYINMDTVAMLTHGYSCYVNMDAIAMKTHASTAAV